MININLASRFAKLSLYLTIVTTVCLPMGSVAQEQTKALRLSLEEAKAIAAEQNALVRAGRLDERAAQRAVAEQRWKRIPQINADYNLQRNLIIPVTPVPANAFDPGAPEGAVVPMRFATDWSSNGGVNGGFELFNPQRRGAIKEALINQELARLDNEQTVRDVIYDAATAYINALVAEAQLQLAIADTVSKSTLLNTSRQMYEEGRLLLTSLNQVVADRNEVLNNLDKARDIYVNNVQQLLLALGMEPDLTVQLQLTDNVDQLLLGERPDFELRTDGIAYRKQMRNDELLQTQIRTFLKGHLPTVQLKGYYGGNYFDNNLDLLQSNNWYGNSYVSLGIRLPLTEGIERHEKVAQLRLKQQSGLLRYQHEEQKNRLEHMNALMEVRTFERNLERVRENFQLAEQNLRLAEQQFSNGRLSLSDMHQAGYVYQLEKNKYLNFVYDYLAAMLKAEWIHSR